ncbi:hypothetical protein ANCCAN_10129, partial [Ancylostoma caninum]
LLVYSPCSLQAGRRCLLRASDRRSISPPPPCSSVETTPSRRLAFAVVGVRSFDMLQSRFSAMLHETLLS